MAEIDATDIELQKRLEKFDSEFVCDICAKEFKMKVTYDQHMSVDQDEKKGITEMCPHCGGEFKSLNRRIENAQCNVPEHLRENKKSFMCEYCNKMFKIVNTISIFTSKFMGRKT